MDFERKKELGLLFGGRESGEKWEKEEEARENAAAITFLFGQLPQIGSLNPIQPVLSFMIILNF